MLADFTADSTAGVATIEVERIGNASAAVSVNFATSNGTAIAGAKYVAAAGTLNFAANQYDQSFNITILPDYGQAAAVTTVDLALSQPTGGADSWIDRHGNLEHQRGGSPFSSAPSFSDSHVRAAHPHWPRDHGHHAHVQPGTRSQSRE